MNTTEEEVEFDYQAYMKDYVPDPDKIHWGPEARQKRREAAIHNNHGLAYQDEGDYDRAIEAFTKAIELNPNYAVAYNNRGLVYNNIGEFDRAIADYTKAIELKPDFVEAYNHRDDAYDAKGDYDPAIVEYRDITQKVIGAALEVHKFLGNGFQEVIYQRALALEMARSGLTFAREVGQDIFYKESPEPIGTRRADFVIEGKVLVELKAIPKLEKVHTVQLFNYLRTYRMEVGLLLNFGSKSMTFKRLILSQPDHSNTEGD